MTIEQPMDLTPRMETAVEEIQRLVTQRFPDATFVLGHGEDPEGIHLIVTVDLDDMGEVFDLYFDRLVDMQLDDILPLYVIPVRPVQRSLEILAREQATAGWFRGA
jgi:hypothetical protein